MDQKAEWQRIFASSVGQSNLLRLFAGGFLTLLLLLLVLCLRSHAGAFAG